MEYIKKSLRITIILICSIFITACNSTNSEEKEEYLLLEGSKFDERLAEEKNPQLIDVRTPEEFSNGTMMHAVNYNILDNTFNKKIHYLDTNKTVFVFCQKGGRSAKATEILKKNGFNSIIELKGGMDAW